MIRFADISDLDGINVIHAQLHVQHIEYRPDIFAPIEQPVFDSLMKEYLTNDKKRIIISENNGITDGYAAITISDTHGSAGEILPYSFVEVNEFAVLNGHCRNHIGTDMMNAVKDFAKEIGAKFVELGVNPKNTGGQAFYNASGFIPKSIKMQYKI